VYAGRIFQFDFKKRIANIPANATALAFHANDEFLYVGTSKPARIKTYSTRTWKEVSSAADSTSLTFGDSIHKMIFRPVRSKLESNYGITALSNEEENVVHELALLTSKETPTPTHGSVPDLAVVFRLEPDASATPSMTPTVAPTAASGAMIPQSKREWKALAALASIWLLHSIAICL